MPSETAALLVSARSLGKGFGAGEARVEVFAGVDLDVASGDLLAVVGPSGCGKSTLLHLLAGLDAPDSGQVMLGGEDLFSLDLESRARLRGEAIGFVFQLHHLLPELTAEENVALPLLIAGATHTTALSTAHELLSRVGLAGRSTALPRALSGGERQRVAIARAVARRPRLLLCDEPTGSLDTAHAEETFELLTSVAEERAGAAVIVTHDLGLAHRCRKVVRLGPTGLSQEPL